jgi:hypothetical protein
VLEISVLSASFLCKKDGFPHLDLTIPKMTSPPVIINLMMGMMGYDHLYIITMMENISYQSPFSGSFFMGFSMNQLFWVP